MQRPRTADLEALLRAINDAGVAAIVVGGAAAVIHGAPITTQDAAGARHRPDSRTPRVVDLDTLIDIERSTGRERDRIVLPILEALRDRIGLAED